jgi:hypothetical protein
MNTDRFTDALGLPGAVDDGQLPLVTVDGHSVTITSSWSGEALEVAGRRGTALVIVDGEPPSDPVVRAIRPWPVVVVAGSPWSVRGADLGLLVGRRGPADHDGLDEATAAALTRSFLELCADGDPRDPADDRSLLDVVPYPIDEAYEPEAVLQAIVDGGDWLELDTGSADEVLTAVARIGGRAVGIAASRPAIDGGRLGPAGCARVARLARRCQRGRHPFVSLVDTVGLRAPRDGCELVAMREAATSLRRAGIVKIAVVTGWAVGLGATMLGAVGGRADAVLPWPRAHFALSIDGGRGDQSQATALAAAGRAAREGDLMDVIHPDDTRSRVIEMLDLLRGRSEYGP